MIRNAARLDRQDRRRHGLSDRAGRPRLDAAGGDERAFQSALDKIQAAVSGAGHTQAGPVDVTLHHRLERDEAGAAAVLRIEHALMAIGNAARPGSRTIGIAAPIPQIRRQLSMMSDLRQAMEKGRLRLVYQPKMSLAHRPHCRRRGADPLVRRNGKMVSPDEFIPLAEATGVIHEVTIFALRTALADMTQMGEEGRRGARCRQCVGAGSYHAGFRRHCRRLLAEAGVPASQLALEVTESSLIRSSAEAIATLEALRAREFACRSTTMARASRRCPISSICRSTS